jgi:hypothetical protein
MEVASAGDCVSDLVSLCMSLAQVLSPALRWWEPLFASYGQEPDFAAFRLHAPGLADPLLARTSFSPMTH